jgi:hypothetical protein
MPIRINLLHEEERALLERQRDPLKLALLGAIVIGIGLFGWYSVMATQASAKRGELATLQAEWDTKKPKAEEGAAKEAVLTKKFEAHQLLVSRSRDRLFWAPVLEKMLSVVRRDMQITSFVGSINEAMKVVISLSGITVGQEPRSIAEYLRSELERSIASAHPESSVTFQSLEENATPIDIQGRSFRNSDFSIKIEVKLPATSADQNAPPKK